MPQLTLTRHYLATTATRSLAEDEAARRSEELTGHPPVPDAALPRLRVHLIGQTRRGDDPRITWHHRDGGAWAAVLDLHRSGDDQAATDLAVFLRWCEARGSHQDHTIWALGELPARPTTEENTDDTR